MFLLLSNKIHTKFRQKDRIANGYFYFDCRQNKQQEHEGEEEKTINKANVSLFDLCISIRFVA